MNRLIKYFLNVMKCCFIYTLYFISLDNLFVYYADVHIVYITCYSRVGKLWKLWEVGTLYL